MMNWMTTAVDLENINDVNLDDLEWGRGGEFGCETFQPSLLHQLCLPNFRYFHSLNELVHKMNEFH